MVSWGAWEIRELGLRQVLGHSAPLFLGSTPTPPAQKVGEDEGEEKDGGSSKNC